MRFSLQGSCPLRSRIAFLRPLPSFRSNVPTAVACAIDTPSDSGPCSPVRVRWSVEAVSSPAAPRPSWACPPPGSDPQSMQAISRLLRPCRSSQRTRCDSTSTSRSTADGAKWDHSADPLEVSDPMNRHLAMPAFVVCLARRSRSRRRTGTHRAALVPTPLAPETALEGSLR
jgi:hypothetical protein